MLTVPTKRTTDEILKELTKLNRLLRAYSKKHKDNKNTHKRVLVGLLNRNLEVEPELMVLCDLLKISYTYIGEVFTAGLKTYHIKSTIIPETNEISVYENDINSGLHLRECFLSSRKNVLCLDVSTKNTTKIIQFIADAFYGEVDFLEYGVITDQ
jgi:hypothetical protein